MSTARARATGLAGLVGILLIVVGTPAALLAIGATPLPNGVPTWAEIVDTLTGVDDGTAVLAAFRLIAWAAWAYLTLGLVLEAGSRVRGLSLPRLRGLALSQSVGKTLVSATLLLFTALPAATLPATAAPAAPPLVAVAPLNPAPTGHAPTATATRTTSGALPAAPAPEAPAEAPATVHTVRSGETLWALAERYLGDGARFREIAAINYGVPQPDGGRLSDSHWIRTGWHLAIPTPPVATSGPAAGVQEYTVQRGDTLWDIADDHLGDATRYGEIYTASTHITQPGGHRLHDPDEISPGWTLHVPTPAAPEPAAAPEDPAPAEGPGQVVAPGDQDPEGAPTAGSLAPEPAPTGSATTTTGDREADPVSGTDAIEEVSQEDVVEAGAWPVRTAAGAGSLLAAGLVALIGVRRAALGRRRRPGEATPMPTGQAADVERALRVVADPFGVETVDVALRALARDCARAGQGVPILRWACLSAGQLDLHLGEPATLPAPWTGTADAMTWTLLVEHTNDVEASDVAGVPAPYPVLVTLGHDLHDGHILIDLEQVGALAVVGPPERTRQVLAALAVELATSAWADDLHITTVLDHIGLEEALQTGRISYQPAIGYLLDDLTTRAGLDRAALAEAGAADLAQARTAGAAPDAWTPEVLLLACALTARHRNLLTALVEDRPRVAIAAVTAEDQIGEWSLTLTDGQDVAVLEPLALRLRPQRLDPVVYDHLLELTRPTPTDTAAGPPAGASAADPATGSPTAEPPPAQAGADGVPEPLPTTADQPLHPDTEAVAETVAESGGHLPNDGGQGPRTLPNPEPDASDPDEPGERPDGPAPYIGVLGPVSVENAHGRFEVSRRARLTEYAAYLALLPGASTAAIDDAIWPDRTVEDNVATRNSNTSRLRAWFGTSADGTYYLPVHDGPGYAFRPEVRTDWHDWQDLLPDGPLDAPTENLERALALVRGRPFEGTHRKRYAWAEPFRQQMTDQIVDAAHELARRHARQGQWRRAEAAVVIGLALDPGLERLWRVRILTAHATSPTTTGAEAIERMLTITNDLGGDLEPETEALLTAIERDADLDELTAIAL